MDISLSSTVEEILNIFNDEAGELEKLEVGVKEIQDLLRKCEESEKLWDELLNQNLFHKKLLEILKKRKASPYIKLSQEENNGILGMFIMALLIMGVEIEDMNDRIYFIDFFIDFFPEIWEIISDPRNGKVSLLGSNFFLHTLKINEKKEDEEESDELKTRLKNLGYYPSRLINHVQLNYSIAILKLLWLLEVPFVLNNLALSKLYMETFFILTKNVSNENKENLRTIFVENNIVTRFVDLYGKHVNLFMSREFKSDDKCEGERHIYMELFFFYTNFIEFILARMGSDNDNEDKGNGEKQEENETIFALKHRTKMKENTEIVMKYTAEHECDFILKAIHSGMDMMNYVINGDGRGIYYDPDDYILYEKKN